MLASTRSTKSRPGSSASRVMSHPAAQMSVRGSESRKECRCSTAAAKESASSRTLAWAVEEVGNRGARAVDVDLDPRGALEPGRAVVAGDEVVAADGEAVRPVHRVLGRDLLRDGEGSDLSVRVGLDFGPEQCHAGLLEPEF